MRKMISVFLLFLTMTMVFSGCSSDLIGKRGRQEKTNIVKVIDIKLTKEEYGIGVDKDQPELLAEVNAALKEMRETGQMQEIFDHYLGDGEPQLVTPAKLDASKDQLVVSSTLDFEPFEYGQIDHYYGIDMEIVAALAEKLGKELVIINTSFEMLFMSVRQHKCDLCIGGITITERRKRYVDFSDPYFETGQQIAVPADNTEFDQAKTASDIEKILHTMDENRVIGVESMTTAQAYCEGDDKKGYAGFPLTVRRFRDLDIAMDAMEDKTIDYVIGDAISLQSIADIHNGVESGEEK